MAFTISLALHLIFFPILFTLSQKEEFIFNGFTETQTTPDLISTREGASIIKPSGALRLTNNEHDVIGRAFYNKPIKMFDKDSSLSSFSTSFVFAIVTPISGQGGYGLAFTLSPSPSFPGAAAEHYMGILNSTNDGNSSNHLFAVEFDTVRGYNEDSDSQGNHVGININSMDSKETMPAYYFKNGKEEEFTLESGNRVQAWIEYDGVNKIVNVTICPMDYKEKPSLPLLSYKMEPSLVFQETMYAGFSASTGKKVSSHYILGWSFSMNGAAPSLNLQQLPSPPIERISSHSISLQVKILIAALSAVAIVLLGLFLGFKLYRRMSQFEVLEDCVENVCVCVLCSQC